LSTRLVSDHRNKTSLFFAPAPEAKHGGSLLDR
jgi:hypothetical protein